MEMVKQDGVVVTMMKNILLCLVKLHADKQEAHGVIMSTKSLILVLLQTVQFKQHLVQPQLQLHLLL